MDNTNFWLENRAVSYAVVNGLVGSMSLWAFWTPFITFLAQPFASAMMKSVFCTIINVIPSLPVLPSSAKNAAAMMVDSDPKYLQTVNMGSIISFWIIAALSIVISLWIVTSIISKGQLDINHIVKLNLVMFFVIIIVELTFFIELGLSYIPFNVQTVFDSVINNITGELKQYQ